MAAATRLSTRYSTGSGRAFILDPIGSRQLLTWLVGLHALAATAVLVFEIGGLAKLGLLVALAAHGYWRRPPTPVRVIRNRNGFWSLPDRGQLALRLAAATRYGDWWVDLHLTGPDGGVRVLLLRDQVDASAWRALQATLRESPAQSL
jgi:hypothetical protein